jgi:nucleotide-binding universal stress UspA family protein
MKQIIVPTDFSKGAWNALLYATELGNALETRNITVLNAYHAPRAGASTLHSIDRIMQEDSEAGVNRWMNKIKESGLSAKFNFHGKSIHATLVDAVNSQVSGYADHLVVMGSLGEAGTVEKIFGSNATDVIAKVQCPVIVIPPKINFTSKKNVVLASDYNQISDSNMKILQLIKKIHPSTNIRIVHVQKEKEPTAGIANLGISQENLPHEVIEISGDNVGDALDRYASSNPTDLMVLIKHESGFFHNLFHHSVTKELALLAHVPLLVLKRTDS